MEEASPGQLHRLPSSTVKLISSAQVITSVSSVVKELMENSLDAGASTIEVHLDGHGLDRIEVRDNGHGIEEEDVNFMCRRSYTSKILHFSDLDKLSSYGFRGEALFSVCSVADVSVTTITKGRPYAKTYKFNHNGEVFESKPANLDKGTTITVTNLFKNLPVRKQFLTSGKRKQEEMKKVEMVVKTLALVNCEVKTRLFHNKFTVFQKASVCNITRSLIQILPPPVVKQLEEICYENDEEKIKFTLLVPKQECNIVTTCLGHSLEATYLFINSRPVREKQIEKAIQEKVFGFFGSKIPAKKHPAMLVSIILPPDMIDVNLEPNKTAVMVRDIEKLIKLLRDQLSTYYFGMDEETMMKEAINMDPPKRKLCSSQNSVPTKKMRKTEKELTDFSEAATAVSTEPLPARDLPQDSQCGVQNGDVSSGSSIFDPPCTSTLEEKPPEEVPQPEGASDSKSKDALIAAFVEGLEQVPLSSPSSAESIGDGDAEISKPIVPDDPFDLLKKNRTPEKSNPDQIEESEFFSQANPAFEKKKDASLNGGLKELLDNQESHRKSELEPFSLTQWSKGAVHVYGRRLEGTTVIASNSAAEETTEHMSESSVDDSTRSERSVSSQMGQKDMSAFTKFAREMRKEIVKADPGISFPRIAKELSKRWQELQDDDKKVYKEMALADKQGNKRKSTDEDSCKVSPPRRKSCETRRPKFAKVYPSMARVNITLDNVREAIRRRNTPDVDKDAAAIMFDVNEDLSLVKQPSAILALSCRRLNEAIKFYNNLNHMHLELKVLEKGMEIKQEDLASLWNTLESLDSSLVVNDLQADRLHTANVLTDERIMKNGFRIEKTECSSGNSYIITDVARNISLYGLDELREILECIAKDAQCKLRSCRPLKAVNLIRSETVRSLTGQDFTRTDYTINLYKHWSMKIHSNFDQCPHHRPVVKKIYP